AADGITIRTGARAERVTYDGAEFTVHCSDGPPAVAEKLLVAVGRHANLAGLGLAAAGLDPDSRIIKVDDRMRAAEKIWAIGDATGHGAFTHVSMYQADIAVRDILGQDGPPADYTAEPHVTFTDPEIGSVGLTERAAREAGINVKTAITQIPSST